MKLGLIGIGVVGKPLYETLKYYHGAENIYAYDIKNSPHTWYKMLNTDMLFVCVPTDIGKNKRLNMNAVDGILQRLHNDRYRGIVVIKSTLRVDYIIKVIDRFIFQIAVFPEWLRTEHALPDTLKPEIIIIGTKSKSTANKILDVCKWHDSKNAIIVLPKEAVMIKLVANALASTKISFANQIMLICGEFGINSHTVMDAIKLDPRCSPRYLTPNNPFGGYCLPKDTVELANCSKNTPLINAVLEINRVIKKRLNDK